MKSSKTEQMRIDAAISGGSYVGLTLALALSISSNKSLKIAVFDHQNIEKPLEKSDGRAFAISAGSRQLLSVLDIWSQIDNNAQPVTKIEITDTELDAIIRPVLLDFENKADDNTPATHIIENIYLLNALKAEVIKHPNIHLFSGKTIAQTAPSGSHNAIELSDGTCIKSKLLIAADGRMSKIREQASIKTIGWSYDQMGIVTTIAHTTPHEAKAVQHFLPSGPFAILPLPGNRSSLVWSEKTEIAKEVMQLDDKQFLDQIKTRARGYLGDITLAGERAAFPLNLQIAREFTAERLALVGDAAHGIHPIAGLGLNIGLRDVAALAEIIINTHRIGLDIGSSPILDEYTKWRRFDSAISAFTMDALNRLFSNDNQPLKIVRDFGLGLVNKSPTLKNYFLNEAAGTSEAAPKLLQGIEL